MTSLATCQKRIDHKLKVHVGMSVCHCLGISLREKEKKKKNSKKKRIFLISASILGGIPASIPWTKAKKKKTKKKKKESRNGTPEFQKKLRHSSEAKWEESPDSFWSICGIFRRSHHSSLKKPSCQTRYKRGLTGFDWVFLVFPRFSKV